MESLGKKSQMGQAKNRSNKQDQYNCYFAREQLNRYLNIILQFVLKCTKKVRLELSRVMKKINHRQMNLCRKGKNCKNMDD